MKHSKLLIGVVFAMFALPALATHPKPKPPKHDPVPVVAAAGAIAGAKSSSTSGAKSSSVSGGGASNATGGTSSATGGNVGPVTAGGGDGGEAGAEANGTQQLSTSESNLVERSNPGVFLPAILVSGCGAGVNGGGSNRNDAGALGITWTTERCYGLQSAINFFAIGDYETGCNLLVDVNRAAFKRVKKPDCAAIAQRLRAASEQKVAITDLSPVPDLSRYATKEELGRAFKDRLSK